MSNGRLGEFSDVDKAVQRFVVEGLEASVMRLDCAKTINVDVEFSRFLVRHGVNDLAAEEIASEQRILVRRKLNQQIERWHAQGVATPLNFIVENEEVVVSWRHERFEQLTGRAGPTDDFVKVYDWIGAQQQKRFLLPCLCFLKALNCDPIFITDGARDEGIDCIGLMSLGGLRSTAIFIQARSRNDLVPGDPLLQEYAKYAGLPRTRKYMDYLEALGVPKLQDGSGFLYAVLTNSDFRYAAQQNASRLGVLIRSRRQLASFIAPHYSVEQLEKLRQEIEIPETGDLSTNLSPRLVTYTKPL